MSEKSDLAQKRGSTFNLVSHGNCEPPPKTVGSSFAQLREGSQLTQFEEKSNWRASEFGMGQTTGFVEFHSIGEIVHLPHWQAETASQLIQDRN